jgi:hypothetical protein
MEVLVALALLAQVLWLALRRQPLATWAGALAGPFIALAGLYAVDWYGSYALPRVTAAPSGAVLLALIFLAQSLWDVSRSGEQVTNGDSPAAPRSGRVQLYFGYVLVTAALFLYGSSLRIQLTGAPVPGELTGVSDVSALGALFLLCPALALVTGLTRWQQWRVSTALAIDRPERIGRARLRLVVVSGAGAVAVAVLAAFSVAVVFHGPTPPPPITYFTHLPGPNCDKRGSSWTTVADPHVTLACDQHGGLHVTVSGKYKLGEIGFGFPNGVASANYRVSVHVTFGAAPACASILTRASTAGIYDNQICSDGSWFISRFDFTGTGSAIPLQDGTIARYGLRPHGDSAR